MSRGVGSLAIAAAYAWSTERSSASTPRPSRAEMKWCCGERQEGELALELALDLRRAARGRAASHLLTPTTTRAARLEDVARQVRVLLGDAVLRVEQQDHDVRVLDRLQRLDDRKLLDRFEHLAAAAHARGVDQRVRASVALEVEIDRVARRARLVERDDALLAEQRR